MKKEVRSIKTIFKKLIKRLDRQAKKNFLSLLITLLIAIANMAR